MSGFYVVIIIVSVDFLLPIGLKLQLNICIILAGHGINKCEFLSSFHPFASSWHYQSFHARRVVHACPIFTQGMRSRTHSERERERFMLGLLSSAIKILDSHVYQHTDNWNINMLVNNYDESRKNCEWREKKGWQRLQKLSFCLL